MSRMTAGGAIFPRLKALGVDYVFANSGTDFPPIIEGLAEAAANGEDLPCAVVIPHEHAAMGMAHGYYLISGRPQAVMMHTNVGLANGAIGAINAACENIPVLMMSGRTPVTEAGRFGARTVPIGWGQEMRDQTALVREASKWDYELRYPEQISGLLDRAHAIANSTPKGPVYLSLPREVLCEDVEASSLSDPATIRPSLGAGDPSAIAEAVALLAGAEHPLIISQRGVGSDAVFEAFGAWVERHGLPVASWWATHLSLPTDHPCHIGADPGTALAKADVVLVINSLAPWWPDRHKLSEGAKVINIGPDPVFDRFPVRMFRSDVTIQGETALILPALMQAVDGLPVNARASARRASLAEGSARRLSDERAAALADTAKGITKAQVSHALGEALQGECFSVFSELGAQLGPLACRERLNWFQEPHSGGLGWSFPAALGAQLADPDRICVATLGDGSYMFANPTVCHQIAEALDLPILIVILNNAEWGAVRQSVSQLYPEGHAARANNMPLTSLSPVPDFTQTAKASRAWTQEVTDPDEVAGAIEDALRVVLEERRLALLNIRVLPL
ncbi:acetolactate synthase-1/2/3 large subunit [Primorskyibacter sedentarius]|uniref:Acetolactate synthase-1/2/3 large subunit n=1 Tax=Primorskyibacter sedentarius TaxID=745311 RepID=A0A4R3JM36_9RHOB|nr:thiamine pyrophosphate-requiring protein [Primorskyibacter sedentarius]TCS67331.1 acetolactate synthase-1/2/3 large subunit [Primorskyibacter sedentarius]